MTNIVAIVNHANVELVDVSSNGARFSLPESVFYLLIITLPFEELFTICGGSITKWIGLLFVLLSLGQTRLFYSSFPLPFIGYLVYMGIGVGQDLARHELNFSVLNQAIGPVLTGVFMVVSYNLAVHRSMPRVAFALFLSAALFSTFQVFDLAPDVTTISSQLVDRASVDRVSALGTDPNFAACFMSLALFPGVLGVSGVLRMRPLYRILSLLVAVLAIRGIVMTGSRGGLLSVTAGMLSILFVSSTYKDGIKLMMVTCGLLAILGLKVCHDPLFRERLENSIETRDTANREDIWHDSLILYRQSMLVGFGYRSYSYDLGQIRGEYQRGSHNVPLSVLLESGTIGFLAFLCLYVPAAHGAWKHRKDGIGILIFPWFVTAFVASLSLNLNIAKWYWLVAALALALGRVRKGDIHILDRGRF